MKNTFHLHALSGEFAVCKLSAESSIPAWATLGTTWSVTRTSTELSVVCPQSNLPQEVEAGRDWRALQVDGPLPFTMVGVLSTLIGSLADAGISVFVLSTYDTDLILVQKDSFDDACARLIEAGHTIVP